MKILITSLLTLFGTTILYQANAQVTAVMQARVEIVSGAGFTHMENAFIDLNPKNLTEKFKSGSFSLISSPGSEISVYLQQNTSLKNDSGEIIEFQSLGLDKKSNSSGKHEFSINGKIKNDHQINGFYEGSITAVVEYL